MSQKVEILRSFVEQRLTAAAEEIFGLFERTIAEYEEELCRTKEENQRQRQILDCVWNPRVLIHKTDVQQLSVVKEEVPPEQQEWNPIVDQEESEPETPHIKEEQEELWTSQEVNITRFPSTPVPVKSKDDDEKKVKSSQLNQTPTEEYKEKANKVNCGRSEPDILVHMESIKRRTFDSKSLLEEHMDTYTGQKLGGSSECEATFSRRKNTTQKTNSPRDMMKNNELSVSDVGYKKKLYHCPVCSKTFRWKSRLEIHMMSHTGEKPVACSVCHKSFRDKSIIRRHMRVHTGERPFHCSVCEKRFTCKSHLTGHMRIHTGEKPFSCSECGKRFGQKTSLECHMRFHTGEKPFSCLVCQKRFKQKQNVQTHMKIHMRK
ncbi:zinc finger protein 182-like [Sphaeramia orbicularis]|uniref:zinc finger protein 182-like n=1 Tax=Sphaeramia orbicularis TaxID=375764 RepID=UPI0011807BC8|nr:zinc finger protein 182-like [Sphaeramia orbicularis]